jgi:hypothetical protein
MIKWVKKLDIAGSYVVEHRNRMKAAFIAVKFVALA